MTGFEDILKSANWHQSLNKSLGISSVISEMLKTKDSITNSYSGISMMAEIAKSMHHQKMFTNPTMSAIEAMTKSIGVQSRFAIPQTTLDAITSINRQHEQLFGNLKSITQTLAIHQLPSSQINSWQFAISGISGQLAAIAASSKKWDLIDDFEAITEEAVSLNERIFDENGITTEGLNDLKEFSQSRYGANYLRSGDFRMGQPTALKARYPGNGGQTRGAETSKYPEEEKTIVIPQVVASERGTA